jgi:hypothetical protein
MRDLAANEHKADKLLEDWPKGVLEQCSDESQQTEVFHFHCMARVLLGFHCYVCDTLKFKEAKIIAENGPLERNSLPVFKYWNKKQTTLTTSDIFGPPGDRLRVCDRWEAFLIDWKLSRQ